MANVFISHRGSDIEQAAKLSADLRDAGHHVWLDEWNIELGDSITGRMNEGLEGAAYVVLCMSDAGVTSPWMGREWLATIARQLNGKSVKLLPVRLTGGEPPALIADLKYADLTKSWSRGVAAILKAMT